MMRVQPTILIVLLSSFMSTVSAFSVVRVRSTRRHPNRFLDGRICSAQRTPLTTQKQLVITTNFLGESSTVLSWLPICSAENVGTVAFTSGMAGLLTQLVLTQLLKKRTNTKHASYTAHTIVAMALMILVSSIGVAGWWSSWLGGSASMMMPATAAGRLIEPDASCRWLAAVVTGMFALWDVPVSLAVKQLRKPDVIAHHIMMTIVASVGALHLPMHYIFFYLGISELSSIPLLCYDQLQVMTDGGRNPNLVALRDKVKVVAAVSFTAVRAWLFTKVTIFRFVPDCLLVLPTIAAGTSTGKVLRFSMWASLGFTALQLYWFSMIVRVIVTGEEELPEADTA